MKRTPFPAAPSPYYTTPYRGARTSTALKGFYNPKHAKPGRVLVRTTSSMRSPRGPANG